jgi:hypothetical protein
VALHIDGAYFVGATRFEYPQWLLAAMVFSGLFADDFVDQVQVVGYGKESGGLVAYDNPLSLWISFASFAT